MKANIVYNGPIDFSENDDGSYKISGVAFSTEKGKVPTKKVKISKKELDNMASTLEGVPLMKDHSQSVDSVIGKVNAGARDKWNVMYSADLHDEKMKEGISKGLLGSVSVGLKVDDVVELEDGWFELFNVSTRELSIVVHPATKTTIKPSFSFSIEEEKPEPPMVVSTSQRLHLYEKYTDLADEIIIDLKEEIKELKLKMEIRDEVIRTMKNEHVPIGIIAEDNDGRTDETTKDILRKGIFGNDIKDKRKLRDMIEGDKHYG